MGDRCGTVLDAQKKKANWNKGDKGNGIEFCPNPGGGEKVSISRHDRKQSKYLSSENASLKAINTKPETLLLQEVPKKEMTNGNFVATVARVKGGKRKNKKNYGPLCRAAGMNKGKGENVLTVREIYDCQCRGEKVQGKQISGSLAKTIIWKR